MSKCQHCACARESRHAIEDQINEAMEIITDATLDHKGRCDSGTALVVRGQESGVETFLIASYDGKALTEEDVLTAFRSMKEGEGHHATHHV